MEKKCELDRSFFRMVTVAITLAKEGEYCIIGTGIFISETTIITCQHVLKDCSIQDIRIIFNQRNDDYRKVVGIWPIEDEYDYRDDVAIIEIEASFEAGEQIAIWTKDISQGEKVFFFGYRQDALRDEIVETSIGYFDSNRGCYNLQDGCTKGFSGGLVASIIEGQFLAVGMVIANYYKPPMRTWVLPSKRIKFVLNTIGGTLPYIEDIKNVNTLESRTTKIQTLLKNSAIILEYLQRRPADRHRFSTILEGTKLSLSLLSETLTLLAERKLIVYFPGSGMHYDRNVRLEPSYSIALGGKVVLDKPKLCSLFFEDSQLWSNMDSLLRRITNLSSSKDISINEILSKFFSGKNDTEREEIQKLLLLMEKYDLIKLREYNELKLVAISPSVKYLYS